MSFTMNLSSLITTVLSNVRCLSSGTGFSFRWMFCRRYVIELRSVWCSEPVSSANKILDGCSVIDIVVQGAVVYSPVA